MGLRRADPLQRRVVAINPALLKHLTSAVTFREPGPKDRHGQVSAGTAHGPFACRFSMPTRSDKMESAREESIEPTAVAYLDHQAALDPVTAGWQAQMPDGQWRPIIRVERPFGPSYRPGPDHVKVTLGAPPNLST